MAYAPLVDAGSVQSAKPARPDSNPSIVLPKVVHEVKPDYTREAMQAKIQGSVYLSVVVLASGEVGDITVTRSLDKAHGLDEEAVKAMRQWTFEPGTRDGNPVPVEVEIEMRFTLK
jgi:protein TonB